MKAKGNILIIVLFILIASSLFAVLLWQQARSLLRSVSAVHDYYKAYYYAYAGIEMWFAQQLQHGYGFEDSVLLHFPTQSSSSGESITKIDTISRNIVISWNPKDTTCDTLEQFQPLMWGESFIIPLFYDTTHGFEMPQYTTISSSEFISQYIPKLYMQWSQGKQIIIKIIDEELKNYNKQWDFELNGSVQELGLGTLPFLQYDSSDSNNKNYLIFANPWDKDSIIKFCLLSKKHMVMPIVTIQSQGNYRDTQVSLYGNKQFQIPWFLSYGTIQ